MNDGPELAITAIPGLVLAATLPTSPLRGFTVMAGALYAVGGSTLYSVSQTGRK
jgi:hypothetical protein